MLQLPDQVKAGTGGQSYLMNRIRDHDSIYDYYCTLIFMQM